ncbi:MAG: hypothetical protein KDC87_04290 [Planctomycetes bacterium]|nr:hypothetical protein [Planctomycetota bacterium]
MEKSGRTAALRLTFAGATMRHPTGVDRMSGVHHYFLGNDPTRWRADVPRFARVVHRDLYPGVDLRSYAEDGHFEYDVELRPGANLAQVEVLVEGADGLHLEPDGSLLIETAIGPLRQLPPRTYLVDLAGRRQETASRCELRGPNRFGFVVPGWRGEHTLVVDPGLVYSSFVGGGDFDSTSALAVDSSGVAHLAGSSLSLDYPTTFGAQDILNGFFDTVVTCLDPSRPTAHQLRFSTFLGGSSLERADAIAVDDVGVLTIAGLSLSRDYPITTNAWSNTYKGRGDVIVTRIDPSLASTQKLVYSTFVGGSWSDFATAIHVDPAGVTTVTGTTTSLDFPTTPNAWNTSHSGNTDFFLTRLDPSRPPAQQMLYSTLIGGSMYEYAFGLSVNGAGIATITGTTSSTDFPTTSGAWSTRIRGGTDLTITRIDPTRPPAQQLVYSTHFGGTASDYPVSLVEDSTGVVTVAGRTESTDFPTTAGAWNRTHNGGKSDAFVLQLDPNRAAPQQLTYSSFLGGSGEETTLGLGVDTAGVITVAGSTNATNFPTTRGAFRSSIGGGYDAFVARLDPYRSAAGQLLYATLLGSLGDDYVLAMAMDAAGMVTIAGNTQSAAYPTTRGAWGATYGGGDSDSFVTRLDMLPTGVRGYGRSSPGCAGVLPISVTSIPKLGNGSFAITCGNTPPSALGVMVLGMVGRGVPLSILGIDVWVEFTGSILVPVYSSTRGTVEIACPLPNDARLANLRGYVQLVWAGPTGPPPCPRLGVSASAALEITIQP